MGIKYHRWVFGEEACTCGCKDRIICMRAWVCLNKVKEKLLEQGYDLVKVEE